jgi:hypothetical protein
MKRNLVLLSVVAIFSLMAGFVHAGAGVGMRIHVPFDFYLEDQLFPTGEYSFQMESGNYAIASHLILWSADGTENRMLLASAGANKEFGPNQLRFNKYGDKYFLSAITIGHHRATVKVFKLERELRSRTENAPKTISVAQK